MPKKSKAESNEEQPGRPFWSGTITFGLVSIPVGLVSASRSSRVPLRMLGPEGKPLEREYFSQAGGAELEPQDTIRGYELKKGKYVTVSDEELERLAPTKSRDINLELFVSPDEISPLYFETPYFLVPTDKSGKAYRLLAETMQRRNRTGIATFVMHGKEHLVAINADHGTLRAQTLRFSDEVRKPTEIGLTGKHKRASSASVRSFGAAIKKRLKRGLDLTEMRDEHADAMLHLIAKKRQGRKGMIEEAPRRREPAKVVDLMEVLKQSLKGGKKSKKTA